MLHTINPWLAMLLVIAILVSLLQVLSTLAKHYPGHEELVRKTLHVTMGMVTMTFPWLFSQVWPVVLLSIASSSLIGFIKYSRIEGWKQVVCAKGRESIGEICFPLAVGLTFVLADGNALLYLLPMAILTFADAASAIVGQKFGKRLFTTNGGSKSVEGSLAFSFVAFIAGLVSAWKLLPDDGLFSALCIALVLAILSMMFEAICWKGLDNLLIPLGALIVLKTHLQLSPEQLLIHLGILLLVSGLIAKTRGRSTLDGSGLIGTSLFSYFSLCVGGPLWALMPFTLFLSYKLLLPTRFRGLKNRHSAVGVLAVASVGMLWLSLAHRDNSQIYLFPYALTFASNAAIISIAHMRCTGFSWKKINAVAIAVAKSWALICLPLAILHPDREIVAATFLLAPWCIAAPTLLFYFANTRHIKSFTRPTRWIKQAAFAAIGSCMGLVALL